MLRMLTELCQELKNWFERKKYFDSFTIYGNQIQDTKGELALQDGQYFRIIGSVFNDGIWQYSDSGVTGLKNESFKGAVWALAIPDNIVSLSQEIDAWRAKYENPESAAMSPFSSESFGGYLYTKASGSTSSKGTDGAKSWRYAFADSLNRWRKI